MSWKERFSIDLESRTKREQVYDVFIDAFAAERCEPQSTKAGSENVINEKQLSELYVELSIKKDNIAEMEANVKSLKAENDLLTRDLQTMKTKMRYNNEEAEAKNRNVQQILDEILALQIQLNLSEQKIEKLEEENRVLIDRWMAKVAGEADQMNQALGQ